MKWIWVTVKSNSESWYDEACAFYLKKIGYYQSIEFIEIKSIKLGRDSQQDKIEKESQSILKLLKEDDALILFDPLGKAMSSEQFATSIDKLKLRSFKRLVFVIGGAFGVTEAVRLRSQMVISLSAMVMNHQVASVMSLEQLYRAITIQKNLPYHNA